MANLAYLSLGSNIEPEQNMISAVRLLAAMSTLRAVSSVWETKPLGATEQANFLNAAALVETDMAALEFKQNVLRPIEQSLGRVRSGDKYGPRTIDIDLMLFNRDIFELGKHHIPNAEIVERAFVAIPLAEIDPDYQHPELGQTLSQIAERFDLATEEMRLRADVSDAVTQFRPETDLTKLQAVKE